MALGHITAGVPWRSQSVIDRIIAVRDTGMVGCITSGNLVTGHGGMVRKCGSVAITSREGTKPVPMARRRHVNRLPSGD
jgi:hypothetical protein